MKYNQFAISDCNFDDVMVLEEFVTIVIVYFIFL